MFFFFFFFDEKCNPMLKILIGTFFHVIRLYSTNVIPFCQLREGFVDNIVCDKCLRILYSYFPALFESRDSLGAPRLESIP